MINTKADTAIELLQCELTALERYQRCLECFDDSASCSELRQLCAEHWDAARLLRKFLRCRCSDREVSRIGNAIACKLEETARRLDEKALLCALKKEEETSLHWYEDALNDYFLPSECQTLVRTKLLPQSQTRVSILNRLLDVTSASPTMRRK
jgi:hypothetical protein